MVGDGRPAVQYHSRQHVCCDRRKNHPSPFDSPVVRSCPPKVRVLARRLPSGHAPARDDDLRSPMRLYWEQDCVAAASAACCWYAPAHSPKLAGDERVRKPHVSPRHGRPAAATRGQQRPKVPGRVQQTAEKSAAYGNCVLGEGVRVTGWSSPRDSQRFSTMGWFTRPLSNVASTQAREGTAADARRVSFM